jgi:hypothetical protein
MPMPTVYTEKDPDKNIVAIFKQLSVPNQAKSKLAGRPIFDDVDVVELRYPGSRNTGVYPATSFSHWTTDPETGEQVKVSYAERFPRQYRQFLERATQTKSGTPLDYALFLTEARRSELRALNIYTIEALAAVDGQELKNLGPHGREAKNKAIEYLEDTDGKALARKLAQELEAAVQKNAVLEEDLKILQERAGTDNPDSMFDEMTTEQLRAYIETNSGHPPRGNLNRKMLLRMAETCKPRAA